MSFRVHGKLTWPTIGLWQAAQTPFWVAATPCLSMDAWRFPSMESSCVAFLGCCTVRSSPSRSFNWKETATKHNDIFNKDYSLGAKYCCVSEVYLSFELVNVTKASQNTLAPQLQNDPSDWCLLHFQYSSNILLVYVSQNRSQEIGLLYETEKVS